MKQVHLLGVALVLSVTTTAWAASVEPYPEAVLVPDISTRTRAEVIAELQEAQHLGLVGSTEDGFASIKLNHESGDAVTMRGDVDRLRAKTRAETREAGRLGLLSFGEGNPPIATAEQEELIAAAGRLAVDTVVSAKGFAQPAAK